MTNEQKVYLNKESENFKSKMLQVPDDEKQIAEAIWLKCAQCVGAENTISLVKNCSKNICPLWNYRLYQVGEATFGR